MGKATLGGKPMDFEPTHYADAPRGRALCGAALVHPFGVSTWPTMVECDECKARLRSRVEVGRG